MLHKTHAVTCDPVVHIRWAKLLRFSRFSGVPQKFFHEYKCLSLIILNNEHLCTAYGQGNTKIFPRNLDGAEIANIYPSKSFPIYDIVVILWDDIIVWCCHDGFN